MHRMKQHPKPQIIHQYHAPETSNEAQPVNRGHHHCNHIHKDQTNNFLSFHTCLSLVLIVISYKRSPIRRANELTLNQATPFQVEKITPPNRMPINSRDVMSSFCSSRDISRTQHKERNQNPHFPDAIDHIFMTQGILHPFASDDNNTVHNRLRSRGHG